MEVAFGVEIVPFKQTFLRRAWDSAETWDSNGTCLFNDIGNLMTTNRHCVVHHSGECLLPEKLDIFCSGFSCASFSPLNNASNSNVKAFEENKALFVFLFLFFCSHRTGFIILCRPLRVWRPSMAASRSLRQQNQR